MRLGQSFAFCFQVFPSDLIYKICEIKTIIEGRRFIFLHFVLLFKQYLEVVFKERIIYFRI